MILRRPVRLELDVEGLSSLHLNTISMGIVGKMKIVCLALDYELELDLVQNNTPVEACTIPSELSFVGVGAEVNHLVDRRSDRDILLVLILAFVVVGVAFFADLRCFDLEGSIVSMVVVVHIRVGCGAREALMEIL